MLECVVNVSLGVPGRALDAIVAAANSELLDLHSDAHHNRSVLTLLGSEAPRSVAAAAVAHIDLRGHVGVHPRIGAVDVVPFVPVGSTPFEEAVAARDAFAAWAGSELSLPCFLYGPERSLPDVRRGAFSSFPPDAGPPVPHPTAGACAVGARTVLVAYNVWLAGVGLDTGRAIARSLRGPAVRALGLQVGPGPHDVQVSMNLVDPARFGPADAYDAVRSQAPVARAELVGLVPRSVLAAVPRARWAALDLAEDRTIEARVEAL